MVALDPISLGVNTVAQGVGAWTEYQGIKAQRSENRKTRRLNYKMFREGQDEATRQFDTQLSQDKEFGEWDRKIKMRDAVAQMALARPQMLAAMYKQAGSMGIRR